VSIVTEILSVEYCRDLEIWVRGHLRSLKMSLIDTSYWPTTYCWSAIVSIALSVTVFELGLLGVADNHDLEIFVRVT